MQVKIEGDEIGAFCAGACGAGKISTPIGGPIARRKIEKLFQVRSLQERGLRIEIERRTPAARDRCEGCIASGRTRSFVCQEISPYAHSGGRRLLHLDRIKSSGDGIKSNGDGITRGREGIKSTRDGFRSVADGIAIDRGSR